MKRSYANGYGAAPELEVVHSVSRSKLKLIALEIVARASGHAESFDRVSRE